MPIFALAINLIQTSFFIVVGILGLGFLIGFHELGHFLFCKLFNIRTPSFSIGMGPKILTKKIGDTEFALSAIPLGGYVEIAGAAEVGQGDQKEAARLDEFSFASKPYYQKLLVMLGGILFNLAFAYAALSILYFSGMPKSALLYPQNASKEISFIEPHSPAQQAGLKEGDIIVSINDQPINTAVEIVTYIRNHPAESIHFGIIRNGSEQSITLTTGQKTIQDKNIGYIGIDFLIPTYGIVDSIKQGINSTHTLIAQVGSAFKMMFADRKIENLGGPLMVISQTIKGAEKGIKVFLLLLAFISVNLAILNLIPLPIMDGGQILFYSIEAIIGRPLPDKVRITIHYICWIGVLALVAFLSIKDITRMFFTH